MSLKFTEIEFDGIGRRAAEPTLQWGKLALKFNDDATDHNPKVVITALLPRGADVTQSQLDEAAKAQALALLSAATDLLQRHSLAELQHQQLAAENVDIFSEDGS